MLIKRLINNNIIVVDDPEAPGKEMLVMGSGIGFKGRPGDAIDETRIEKRYRLVDAGITSNLVELIEGLPSRDVALADILMRHVEDAYQKEITGSLYIAVLDHVSGALRRHAEGLDIKNPVLWDIRRFYPEEYALGLELLDIIEREMGTRLADDEAGFLALYIANAQLGLSDVNQIKQVTDIVHAILSIVKYRLRLDYDEDSVHYHRFVTHLKFFAQRLLSHNDAAPSGLEGATSEMLLVIGRKYADVYSVTFDVERFLNTDYGYVMNDDERLYLAIHIANMLEMSRGGKGGDAV